MPTQDNSSANAGSVTLTTITETPIVATPFVNYNMPGGEGNLVQGNIVCALGAGTTSYTWRVYQSIGGAPGTVIKSSGNVTATASTTVSIGFECLDSSAAAITGNVPISYSVTLQQNAATGNGSVAAGLGVISVTPSTSAS